MKEGMMRTGFLFLGTGIFLLKIMIYAVLIPVFLFVELYRRIIYEAQCLRYPPPPGGMYAQVGRRIKK